MASCGLRAGLFLGRVHNEMFLHLSFGTVRILKVDFTLKKVRKTINPEITNMQLNYEFVRAKVLNNLKFLVCFVILRLSVTFFYSNKSVRFYSVANNV